MKNNEAYKLVRNQDALEYCKKQSMLEQMLGNDTWRHYEYAAKALEKRIPKKPVFYTSWFSDAPNCPSCGVFLGIPHIDNDMFCNKCGQAIDWSDWYE